MSSQESDRSIVVRDGRAVHMAKGSTRRQGDQSTCAEGKKVPPRSVSSSLIALRQKASREPAYRFRGLYTMINLPMLRERQKGSALDLWYCINMTTHVARMPHVQALGYPRIGGAGLFSQFPGQDDFPMRRFLVLVDVFLRFAMFP